MGDYGEALEYYQKALAIREKVLGAQHPSKATSYSSIGLVYHSMGDYPKALEYYQKALAISEKVLGLQHPDTAAIYNNFGGVYDSMGDYGEALEYAQKSFDSFLVQRDSVFGISDMGGKEAFLKSNQKRHEVLLYCAYKLGSTTNDATIYPETFGRWINYKGSLDDSENMMAMLYRNTSNPEVKLTIQKLNSTKAAYAKLQGTLPSDAKKLEAYKQRNAQMLTEIASLEQALSGKVSSYQEELGLRHLQYTDIAKKLKEGELYLDFAKAGDRYYLFGLDNNGVVSMSEIESKQADKLIQDFRKDIDMIADTLATITPDKLASLSAQSKTKLSQLYTLLLKNPIGERAAKANKLIISADGALRLLPFEALVDESGYLIESKALLYTPSAKEFLRGSKDKHSSSKDDVPVFFDPQYDAQRKKVVSAKDELNTPNTNSAAIRGSLSKLGGFTRLDGSVKEANDIKSAFGSNTVKEYRWSDASEKNLQNLKQPKILHISTHGFFINDERIKNPMLKSGIALKGANDNSGEGIITALGLSGLDLKGTNIVVVSACETGMVDPNSTESISALSKAFLQAGASNALVTLWSVSDSDTADLMKDFYTNVHTGNDTSAALKKSKLTMIHKGLHPFFWAGFVMNGKAGSL
jgi:CHAT domain-containing protein